jgi:AraC-like DNA-binding protein
LLSITSIFSAALINGLFQILLLLSNRLGNLRANRYLALLLLLLVMSLWNIYVDLIGLSAVWKTIDYNNWITPYLWAPVLYFYVITLTEKTQVTWPMVATHFSLAALVLVIDLIYFATGFNDTIKSFYSLSNTVRLLSFYVQFFLYAFASYLVLKEYDQKVRDTYSTLENRNLKWLQRLIFIYAVIIVVDMSLVVPAVLRHENVPYLNIIMLTESAAIFVIGYFSLVHSGLLLTAPTDQAAPKYAGSPIDSKLSSELMVKLKRVMEDEKPYLRNELNLSDLSELVGVSPYYLSQVINEQSKKNFYDFINEYRTNYAAEILRENEKSTITYIAFEAGFNNRVSFNNAFKKYMGMTPSQYRRKENAPRVQAAE